MMPTIRIDEEVWRYLQSKAKPFEDSPNDVLRRELGLHEVPVTPSSVAPKTAVVHRSLVWPTFEYTHHIVNGYELDGQHYPARSFREVLMGVSKNLRVQHLGRFDQVAVTLWGKKRPYFSLDPKDLRYPGRVADSSIFAEINLNANLIVAICMTLVKELGHDLKAFKVI